MTSIDMMETNFMLRNLPYYIEEYADNVYDLQKWTITELKLLHQTLAEYPFIDQITLETTIIRQSGTGQGSTLSNDHGVISQIFDGAWNLPPAAGLGTMFTYSYRGNNQRYFQGAICHELTHAAVASTPELLDIWERNRGTYYNGRGPTLGLNYQWGRYDHLDYGERMKAYSEELFAMFVSAYMYEPFWNWFWGTGQ